jgi:hypothetical protein
MGRYWVRASWLIREGDPDSAACVSEDGEAWECEVVPDGEGDMAGRHELGGQALGVTPTGFVTLVEYFPDDPNVPAATEMVVGTSPDGVAWSFRPEPDLPNLLPLGLASTSHGVFMWAGTNPNLRPEDISEPVLLVHRAPLP